MPCLRKDVTPAVACYRTVTLSLAVAGPRLPTSTRNPEAHPPGDTTLVYVAQPWGRISTS